MPCTRLHASEAVFLVIFLHGHAMCMSVILLTSPCLCRYARQPDASSSAAEASNGATMNGAAPFLGQIKQPDGKEALAFIRAHSPDPEDLLLGLCQFTERWLTQVLSLMPHPQPWLVVHWLPCSIKYALMHAPCTSGIVEETFLAD